MICIPVPATKVNVSVVESATTVFCPLTAILVKLFDAPLLPVAEIVIVSLSASVVKGTLVPATKVKVSVAESATTSDCPEIVIVLKAFPPAPPAPVAILAGCTHCAVSPSL